MKHLLFLLAFLSFGSFAATTSTFVSTGLGTSNTVINSTKSVVGAVAESHTLGGVLSTYTKADTQTLTSTINQSDAFTTSQSDTSSGGITTGIYTETNASAVAVAGTLTGLVVETETESFSNPSGSYSSTYTTTDATSGTLTSAQSSSSILTESYIH